MCVGVSSIDWYSAPTIESCFSTLLIKYCAYIPHVILCWSLSSDHVKKQLDGRLYSSMLYFLWSYIYCVNYFLLWGLYLLADYFFRCLFTVKLKCEILWTAASVWRAVVQNKNVPIVLRHVMFCGLLCSISRHKAEKRDGGTSYPNFSYLVCISFTKGFIEFF